MQSLIVHMKGCKTQRGEKEKRPLVTENTISSIEHDLRGSFQTMKTAIHLIKVEPQNIDETIKIIERAIKRVNPVLKN